MLAALFGAGVAYAASQGSVGVIGPATGIQPSGRHLEPEGRLTPLGNLPTGGALTTNGRVLWALSTGRGRNDVRGHCLLDPAAVGANVVLGEPARTEQELDPSRPAPGMDAQDAQRRSSRTPRYI